MKPPLLVKKGRQSLMIEQVHKLLKSMRYQRLELELALVTGMRRGELLALRRAMSMWMLERCGYVVQWI